uniref:Protein preY, mitochondrial n=1 Tax=Bubo bubo TaxID=30461 RepID=A0A8C0FLY7_BUBBB
RARWGRGRAPCTRCTGPCQAASRSGRRCAHRSGSRCQPLACCCRPGSSGKGWQRANPGYSLLRLFVCFPLTCLARYEEATNELINEELGIAYPIIDGIPNMVPEAARTTQKKPPAEGSKQP